MARIYENMTEAVNEIERDIMEMGIKVHPHTMQNKNVKDDKNYETLEVQNYSFTIMKLDDKDTLVPNLKWCKEEFAERISSVQKVNPGTAWVLRKEVWEEFLNEKGEFDYSYHDRMNYMEQVNHVIDELKNNPDTRQALIHVNFPEDCQWWQTKRIPCSVYYQLMIRRGKLDIIYCMRSSDYDTHFFNDIWLADELRNYIAKKVNIEPGLFHMNIGSLHRYRNYTTKVVF